MHIKGEEDEEPTLEILCMEKNVIFLQAEPFSAYVPGRLTMT